MTPSHTTDSSILLSKLSTIGITPVNISLYETACVHRSYLNEIPETIEHNERLEFLGDAALELAMTHLIFLENPSKEEGWMTDLRSSYVRGTHLAEIALQYGFDEVLLLSSGERSAGGAKNPNILADMFEAVLGALYLDQGFESVLVVVRAIIFTSEKVRSETKDPKSRLQELIQKHLNITPEYEVIQEEGRDHAKFFTITASISGVTIGTGVGPNKKSAQESAASDALLNLERWENILQAKS